MSRRAEAGKIVWAVDVFGDAEAQGRMLKVMDLWTRGRPSAVEPVYVCAPHAHWPAAGDQDAVERDLRARFERFGAVAPGPAGAGLTVVRAKEPSLRGKAAALLEHASAGGASLIALTTRARTGVSRWAFGSMTETVLLSSRVPLLTLNPEARPIDSLERILFPTDLSKESDEALGFVAGEAKARGLALSIVHCSQFDQTHSDAAYGPAVGYDAARDAYLTRTRERLNERVLLAEARGLDAEGILLEGKYDVAEAILEAAAERKAQLIALASHCGALDAALGGSVTRRVVRAAACPVLAFHQG